MAIANNIYDHTRSSLLTIVSANVADHTLESVMSASGLTQDTIDAGHMMELIRGPIYREFQTIVPKDGLRRQLTKLIGELEDANSQPITGLTGVANTRGNTNTGVPNTSQTPRKAEQSANSKSRTQSRSKSKASKLRKRVPGLTTISPNAIGIPRAYFRDPRNDAFDLQMPLYGTDPHVVLDNGTRSILRYWISEVAFVSPDELKKAGYRRYSFMIEEEAYPNPTIVKLLEMLREEEEAEQESLMLEKLAAEAKLAAEQSLAAQMVAKPSKAIAITQKDIEDLAEQYAELEDVSFVAILGSDGQVLNSKGRGLDIEKLKTPLFKALGRLSPEHYTAQYPNQIENFSRCDSILLQHDSGMLYILDYVDTILLIYSRSDSNIGLMYNYANSIKQNNSNEQSDDVFKQLSDATFKVANKGTTDEVSDEANGRSKEFA